MADGLLTRACRVVEAGVGSAVEAVERFSGPSLMRQAVRDAEHAVDDARRQQRRANGRAAQAGERVRLADERVQKMDEEARYALSLGRDDLATAAITQKQAASADAESAREMQAASADEAARLDATIAELAARHKVLGDELQAYEQVTKTKGDRAISPVTDDKIAKAEERFARAMSAVGGAELAASGARGIDELKAIRRDEAIAKELAQLKAGMGAALRGRRA